MDINALKDFQLIADWGGIGAASRASGKPKATLSRRLAELEDAIGIRLIERGGHRLKITEAGELLLSRIAGPMREIDEALTSVRENLESPSGCLRVSAPLLFSQLALGRILAAFHLHYPEIRIDVVSDNRVSDLFEEHFDVAIRINPRESSSLVGRCFARDRQVLVAAPSFEIPAKATDKLPVVPAVVMSSYSEGDIWTVRDGQLSVQPQPVMCLTSLLTIRDAVMAGAGVAMLPQSIVSSQLEQNQLVSWGDASNKTELWVLHTSRRLQSPKVKCFVEFICAQYPGGWFYT